MTRGDRGRGRGDRGRGTGGRRGRPRKRTGIPLDLGDTEAETSTPPPVTQTPVIPTPSLSEGLPAMRMIPTPRSRTTTGSEDPPPPEPDPMTWPPVNNSLPEGEEEDIALEEELARQAGRIYLRYDGGTQGHDQDHVGLHELLQVVRALIQHGTGSRDPFLVGPLAGILSAAAWIRVCHLSVLADEVHQETPGDNARDPQQGGPHGWIRDDLWKRLEEFWRQEDFKKLKQTNKRNRASETGGSLHTGGSTTYKATREWMALELGRQPKQSEVFARTHTRKEDQDCVDRCSHDVGVAYEEELKRLKAERQAIIDAGGPEPPPIDEDALWAQFAGDRRRGRIYGKGVVPSHKYPPVFADTDDDDTATGPPDVREQVVLLNRELSQQAEAHAHKVAAVEATCSENVRSLESTVQAQSQEVSNLRKAYSDMYSYLSQIRSSSSASGMPEMPPPPARSQDPPP
ncbi:hypothetical protein PIB30_006837 [Stylosanthes scabra]|uniref:Uncharacterized protein n=1 Tax=Stylosanthes scabra TaxID=79078 RepID=A0ABU6V2N1_9FABA|nr:hypothetical protein [Stylosanthes scabra]